MRYLLSFVCCLSALTMAGCAPAWKANAKKIVATSPREFEKEGRRLCPYGYDIVGEAAVFVTGQENTRYIRCRNE